MNNVRKYPKNNKELRAQIVPYLSPFPHERCDVCTVSASHIGNKYPLMAQLALATENAESPKLSAYWKENVGCFVHNL